jgi:uncharacterized integral membrane protein
VAADEHEATPPPGGPPAKPEDGSGFPIRLLLLGLLGLYLLLFIILNADQVSVSFVFFSTQVSLIVGFALVAVLGFIGGYTTRELRDRRKRSAKPPS